MDYYRELDSIMGQISSMPLIGPNQRPPMQCTSDMEHRWTDLIAGVDERFKGAEDRVTSRVNEMQNSLWQSVSTHMESVQKRIEEVVEEKLTSLLEDSMQALERQIHQMVEEKLQTMERRIKRVDRQIIDVKQNARRSGAASSEETRSSGSEGEREICSGTRMKMGEIDARVTALESSVQKAVCETFPKVDALFDKLGPQSRRATTEDHFRQSMLAAAGFVAHMPISTPYQVNDPNLFSLDRELLIACHHGAMERVRKFLYQGANVNVHDEAGLSPLHLAARRGHTEVLDELIKNGADVNGGNVSKTTPLHWAVIHSHSRCIASLIRAGADVERKTGNNWTALHFACSMGKENATRMLLEAGADRSAINADNKTPLELTTSVGVRQLLSGTPHKLVRFSLAADRVE